MNISSSVVTPPRSGQASHTPSWTSGERSNRLGVLPRPVVTTSETVLIFKALIMNPVSEGHVDYYDPGYLVVRRGSIERLQREDPRSDFPDAEFHDRIGAVGRGGGHLRVQELAGGIGE